MPVSVILVIISGVAGRIRRWMRASSLNPVLRRWELPKIVEAMVPRCLMMLVILFLELLLLGRQSRRAGLLTRRASSAFLPVILEASLSHSKALFQNLSQRGLHEMAGRCQWGVCGQEHLYGGHNAVACT